MLRLHNDLTRKTEPFRARDGAVNLYVCGITPYDTTHLGHAFTYASFDILVRCLEWQGCAVRYVQNVTDIDDDMVRKARETGEDWHSLGNRWMRRYIDDMEALNVRPPDILPRASESIPAMIEVIDVLLARGHAYARGGSVYYRASLAPLGRLSGLPREEWLRVAGQRGNVAEDPQKEDPLDCVLWQAQAPGEPAWPSPWGEGRPGWHIECSTMSALYLPPVVDIHGGGADLSFPHHECEIAQGEAYLARQPFARFWLHAAMMQYRGAKMSKSLGNLVMVQDLLHLYPPDALRLYLASHHYRTSWSYEPAALPRAAEMARRWQDAIREGGRVPSGAGERCRRLFQEALEDDLDTPRALAALDGLVQAMGRLPAGEAGAPEAVRELAGVLGLRLDRGGAGARTLEGWEAHKVRFGGA